MGTAHPLQLGHCEPAIEEVWKVPGDCLCFASPEFGARHIGAEGADGGTRRAPAADGSLGAGLSPAAPAAAGEVRPAEAASAYACVAERTAVPVIARAGVADVEAPVRIAAVIGARIAVVAQGWIAAG